MTVHLPRLPFSLDPLMAEAKRRARQRRVLLAVAVAVVAAGAVLAVELRGLGSVAPVPAKLTVLAVNENSGRAVFHLRCDPAGGNVARPGKACVAIAAQPSIVTAPKSYYDWGGNDWHFTITGRLDGRAVHSSSVSSWTTRTALIEKLGLAGPNGGPLRLEPRRHASVGMGQARTFARGVLRPGDLVTCRGLLDSAGHPLAIGVPYQTIDQTGGPSSLGFGRRAIKVGLNANGSVTASCVGH